MAKTLETKINSMLKDIAAKRKIPKPAINTLLSHHTRLSTARVMLKTHKYSVDQINELNPDTMKTRPIVSGCNSPFQKALWFICHILAPLMKLVPSHLENTYHFLSKINSIPKETLQDLTFFTADVEALYTNINVSTAIDDIIEFAEENKDHICTYGLKLRDIHELLELTLGNSYFVYNRQIYLQLQGLFMGSNPAPPLATVRMWKLERSTVYTDLRITLPHYSRFYDDLGGTTTNQRKAQQICNLIEQADTDQLIKLTVDYPSSREEYIPFLNTEIKIDSDGSVNSRLYRKPQKKMLTLHWNSQHCMQTKIATVEGMYNTAEYVSSNEDNKIYSTTLIDTLLLNNGYNNRILEKIKEKKKKKKKPKYYNKNTHNCAVLKLPYLNETTSRKYKDAVRHSGLNIRIVETPGQRLRDLLTDSRPLDKANCTKDHCRTCDALSKGNCTSANVIYHITCTKDGCKDNYCGESYRPLHERYEEHYRSAANPTAKSYADKPLAKHYLQRHPNEEPSLKLEIADRGKSLINRKIKEAKLIKQSKPTLNDKTELNLLQQFLVE